MINYDHAKFGNPAPIDTAMVFLFFGASILILILISVFLCCGEHTECKKALFLVAIMLEIFVNLLYTWNKMDQVDRYSKKLSNHTDAQK